MGFKKNMCLILFLFSINLISGCTSNEVLNQDSTVKDLSNDIESTEVFAEQLTSLDVNYLSNDSFKFKTNIEESYNGLKIIHFSDLHYKKVITEKRVINLIKEINKGGIR